jgi:hypothetical protein
MFDSLSEKIAKITVSDLANLASILSFIITLYVFYAIRKIKSFYVSKASLPDLLTAVKY